jgi:pyruvate formate lyase activating enzyme
MASMTRECGLPSRPAELSVGLGGGRVRCLACGHRCVVFEGCEGVCKLRFNRGGKLFAPWGYVSGIAADPIEKKPFFHVLPGSTALSFGMLGCSFHCSFCQNWTTSQALRDPSAQQRAVPVEPQRIVEQAIRCGSSALISTYNEPLITAEWSIEVFRLARKAGLLTGFVSNGYASMESLASLLPWLDLFKVDLKSFDDRTYRRLGGRLEVVLDSIRAIHALGYWLEVVTLVVPGMNDSDEELRSIARFLASVSPSIPWHVTAFHPEYKALGNMPTPRETLLRAAAIGRGQGLDFVYAGNLPGRVGALENTACPACGEVLVERSGYRIAARRVSRKGLCPRCSHRIPGRWETRLPVPSAAYLAPMASSWPSGIGRAM